MGYLRVIVVALLLALQVGGLVAPLPAVAQVASPTPSDSPAPSPSPTATPIPGPSPIATDTPENAANGAVSGFSWWFGGIVSVVLSLWPSTPDALKLSTYVNGLETRYPFVPWYLFATFFVNVGLALMFVAIRKYAGEILKLMFSLYRFFSFARFLGWIGELLSV